GQVAGTQFRELLERDGDHYVLLPRDLCYHARGAYSDRRDDCAEYQAHDLWAGQLHWPPLRHHCTLSTRACPRLGGH
ncbi:hypothetical protein A2U01_0077597, partial [Trifolium medium]|nr:hypothetical protein [Trifolium medium]